MSRAQRERDYLRSQEVTTLVINGRTYERIRFDADETDDAEEYRGEMLCGHCEVSGVSFHLLGCEAERCPRCSGQIISYPCEFEQRPGKPPLD